MKFLSIYRAPETNRPPTQAEMERMGALVQEMMASGKLLATEGCLPSAAGARVRIDGGSFTVTDGPFAESKEVVCGFALLEAESKEEAIELTRTFLSVVGTGECEVRQLATYGDCPGAEAFEAAAAAAA